MSMTPDSPLHQAVEGIVTGTLDACAIAAVALEDENLSPADVAHKVVFSILANLAILHGDDNVCVLMREHPQGGWNTHIHYDYLSSDHDHFKEDFDWQSPEPENG